MDTRGLNLIGMVNKDLDKVPPDTQMTLTSVDRSKLENLLHREEMASFPLWRTEVCI